MTFNFTNGVYFYTTRPNSHSNITCIRKMIEEMVANKPLNEVEKLIFDKYILNNKNVDNTANAITSNSWMNAEKVNICHKIPISAFMKALAACMNFQVNNPQTAFSAKPWSELVELYTTVISVQIASPTADVRALYNAVNATGKEHQACTAAWQMCLAFDSSHNNLYFGNASTNSSISDNSDFHYNVLVQSPTDGPTPPTPRGPAMQSSLNALESALGLAQTQQITETDSDGDWAMNSGVNGKKTIGTGFVLI